MEELELLSKSDAVLNAASCRTLVVVIFTMCSSSISGVTVVQVVFLVANFMSISRNELDPGS